MISDYRKTIPAFTLWEVIIAMIITTILVTLSYGAYRQFTGMIEQDNRNMEEILHLSELEKDLQWLVSSAEKMEIFGDEIVLDGAHVEASLLFSDGLMEVYHDGELVTQLAVQDWSVEFLDDHSELIHSFSIICSAGQASYTLLFTKTYSRKYLYSAG